MIKCYNMLRSHSYGLWYVWEANTIGDDVQFVNAFGQRINDGIIQQLHSQIEGSPKSRSIITRLRSC